MIVFDGSQSGRFGVGSHVAFRSSRSMVRWHVVSRQHGIGPRLGLDRTGPDLLILYPAKDFSLSFSIASNMQNIVYQQLLLKIHETGGKAQAQLQYRSDLTNQSG